MKRFILGLLGANLATNDQEGRAKQSSAALANPCRRASELRTFFLIHQPLVNFLRRRANEDFLFDVLVFSTLNDERLEPFSDEGLK